MQNTIDAKREGRAGVHYGLPYPSTDLYLIRVMDCDRILEYRLWGLDKDLVCQLARRNVLLELTNLSVPNQDLSRVDVNEFWDSHAKAWLPVVKLSRDESGRLIGDCLIQ